MSISAVGFLFQDNVKGGSHGKNYTCVIHKKTYDGNFKRNTIHSPEINSEKIDYITPLEMKKDISDAVKAITMPSGDKFIGAAVKDGEKETEIHSMLSDKLYAVRTKDETGKNKFRILGKEQTQGLLAQNLYLSA